MKVGAVMAIKNIAIHKSSDTLIPRAALELLMDCENSDALRLYMYILSCGGVFDDESACARLKMDTMQISGALDMLSRLGLTSGSEVKKVPERPAVLPEYTAGDVAKTLETDEKFSYLLKFAEERLGKILTTADTQTLLGIYSWMGLPIDVICMLITCCADETRRKYGEGRRPTMRNIESRARMWLNMGITTHAQAESYLQEQQERGTRLAQISRLLHIGGRALSVTENRYISSWQIFSDELILKAYDITVVKTGSLKWKYMDTILKNWQSKGFTTPEDVDKKDTPRATPSTGKYEQDSMEKLREINRKRGTS